jgi:hypothetical protein
MVANEDEKYDVRLFYGYQPITVAQVIFNAVFDPGFPVVSCQACDICSNFEPSLNLHGFAHSGAV